MHATYFKHSNIYIAFGWAKEKGQKSLALETAIGMWQLLFAERQWPLVEHWCQFLQVEKTEFQISICCAMHVLKLFPCKCW